MSSPCDETIEWEIRNDQAVDKLQDARDHQKDTKGVNQLETRRCIVLIRLDECLNGVCS